MDTQAAVTRFVEFHVEQHNTVIPHSALGGRTPDEVYFGREREYGSSWLRHGARHGPSASPPTEQRLVAPANRRPNSRPMTRPPSDPARCNCILKNPGCFREQQGATRTASPARTGAAARAAAPSRPGARPSQRRVERCSSDRSRGPCRRTRRGSPPGTRRTEPQRSPWRAARNPGSGGARGRRRPGALVAPETQQGARAPPRGAVTAPVRGGGMAASGARRRPACTAVNASSGPPTAALVCWGGASTAFSPITLRFTAMGGSSHGRPDRESSGTTEAHAERLEATTQLPNGHARNTDPIGQCLHQGGRVCHRQQNSRTARDALFRAAVPDQPREERSIGFWQQEPARRVSFHRLTLATTTRKNHTTT
jgi:hypothetical protein